MKENMRVKCRALVTDSAKKREGIFQDMIGIGIDTGGTYTDIVVYDTESGRVLGSGKTPTTKDHLEVCILKALDSMDQSYIHQAELLALSTTLATNACLENKGGRAKCLMIGMNPESMSNLDQVYGSYGFRDLSQLVFIDGKPEHLFDEPGGSGLGGTEGEGTGVVPGLPGGGNHADLSGRKRRTI